jgi:hypothetical protein
MHDPMDKMKRLMERKGAKELSPMEKKARMSMVDELRKMAEGEMKDRAFGKVTVASDSPEGLKKGLEMAKDKVEMMPESAEEEMEEASEDEESEEEYSEDEDMYEAEMSEDEIDAKLAELMKLKEKMKRA